MTEDRELNEVHVPDRRHRKKDGTPVGPVKRFNAWFLAHFGIISVAFGLCGYLAWEIFNPLERLNNRVTTVEQHVIEMKVHIESLRRADSLSNHAYQTLFRKHDANDRLMCLTASEERLLLMAASEIPCGALLKDLALEIPLAQRQKRQFERVKEQLP